MSEGGVLAQTATQVHVKPRRLAKQLVCVTSFVFTDALTFALALQLGILLREGVLTWIFPNLPHTFELEHYLDFWWMPAIWLFFLGVEGLYTQRRTYWDELGHLWKAATLTMLTIFAVVALGKISESISRPTLLFTWLALLGLIPISRSLIKIFLFQLGPWRKNVLILGAARTGQMALNAFHRERILGYRVVGFLDDDPEKQGEIIGESQGMPVHVLGEISRARNLIEGGLADDVVIAMPGLHEEKLLALIENLQKYATKIMVIPNVWSLPMMSLRLDIFLRNRLFTVTIPNNLSKPWNRWLKRAFDLFVATVLLLASAPLLLVIAAAIKLTSKGPVIYKHRRLGWQGRLFHCYKFRTMVANADRVLNELLSRDPEVRRDFERYRKLKADPRVTAVGRILRKLSLDELPQLFNVLKGEMSLIGPRPVMEDEMQTYYACHADWYYCVKPGITGLWQVSGKNDLDYEERVAMDVWYIRNWSLWLDVIIAIRTVKTVLKMEGAY